jgi:hypothetical protein
LIWHRTREVWQDLVSTATNMRMTNNARIFVKTLFCGVSWLIRVNTL